MSTQTRQYLFYGIKKPFSFEDEWSEQNGKDFGDTFDKFMGDSAFKSEAIHHDGIACISDGRDGRYCFIGRIIDKARDGEMLGMEPIDFLEVRMTPLEQELIRDSIKRNFGLDEPCRYWFFTHLS